MQANKKLVKIDKNTDINLLKKSSINKSGFDVVDHKKAQELYIKSSNTFSGADIVATITSSHLKTTYVIGELQTISYSIHRAKTQVRALGKINPSGIAKGTRTIAGSLIFTVFDKNIVKSIVNSSSDKRKSFITVFDEMPPFDVTILFSNESGNKSKLIIKGIEIINEGQTMSIEDIITESVLNYVAQDIEVMDIV